MKIPFSYREPNFFRAILVTSFLSHLAFLGASHLLTGSPRYAVEQAPRSIEVVLIKKLVPIPKIKKAEIFSAENSLSQEVVKKNKQQKETEKSSYVPPQKGAVTEAKPVSLKNPAPIYPELARQRGWEGTTILSILVGKNGKVENIQIQKSSGHKILDEAALKAVRDWEFMPARIGNLTFSSSVLIPVKFVLVDKD